MVNPPTPHLRSSELVISQIPFAAVPTPQLTPQRSSLADATNWPHNSAAPSPPSPSWPLRKDDTPNLHRSELQVGQQRFHILRQCQRQRLAPCCKVGEPLGGYARGAQRDGLQLLRGHPAGARRLEARQGLGPGGLRGKRVGVSGQVVGEGKRGKPQPEARRCATCY